MIRAFGLSCGLVIASGQVFLSAAPCFAAMEQVTEASGESQSSLVTWPKSGEYTTALMSLPDGNPVCITLMKPGQDASGSIYDISIWRQKSSIHLWLTSRRASFARDSVMAINPASGPPIKLAITRHAQTEPGRNAVSADLSEGLLEKIVKDASSNQRGYSTISVGKISYRFPGNGLVEAIRHLSDCSKRL